MGADPTWMLRLSLKENGQWTLEYETQQILTNFSCPFLSPSKGSPNSENAGSIWALPKWGGGVSTLAQMVWGTYFEKNCPCLKGHLLGLGGLNPCQDGLGHLCSEN